MQQHPLEFWIGNCGYMPNRAFNSAEQAKCHAGCDGPLTHVIEYSAYETLKLEAEKDYSDMRKFQGKFIGADQENIALKQELAEMNRNCISLSLHESRMQELTASVRGLVEALEGINICCGYDPDHVAEDYKFCQEIIEELRQCAREALAKFHADHPEFEVGE